MKTIKNLMLILLILGAATPFAMPAGKRNHESGDNERSIKRQRQNSQEEANAHEAKEVNQCIICLNDIKAGEDILTLPKIDKDCGHAFHRECLVELLAKSEEQCPLCRKEIDLSMIGLTDLDNEKIAEIRAADAAEAEEISRRRREQIAIENQAIEQQIERRTLLRRLTRAREERERSNAIIAAEAEIEANSALLQAARTGNAATTRMLLSARANINAVDNRGRTALDIATENGHVGVVALLAAHVNPAARRIRSNGINRLNQSVPMIPIFGQ